MDPHEFHIVVEVWTVDSAGRILVTLRDSRKNKHPGQWENTGGSVLAGETSIQGAVRELWEETGIRAAERELVFLGTYRKESAFVDSYLLRRDVEIAALTLQEGETVDAKWITAGELLDMIADKRFAFADTRRPEWLLRAAGLAAPPRQDTKK